MKFSISAGCCAERTRRVPDCSKSTQDASRMAPRAPKTPPEWHQEHPRRLPDGYKRPMTPPRRLHERLSCRLNGSKRLQDTSRTTPTCPRGCPRASWTSGQGSKRPPRAPKTHLKCDQEGHRGRQVPWEALCSIRSAHGHARKNGLWTKLVQACGQHHLTSLCHFCVWISTAALELP